MKRVLIFTGGRLDEWAIPLLRSDDYIIGADYGAAFLVKHNIHMHIAVGDFDSVTDDELSAIRSNSDRLVQFDATMKDYSDTELAFRLAAEQSPDEILLFGAIGTRFDHSLANVHLLMNGLHLGITCRIIDEYNEIQLTQSELHISNPEHRYTYVSLLPVSMEVHGVTLVGFQYPLNDATLTIGQSLAVSNKLTAATGIIRIRSGYLLVIQSKD